MSRTFLLLLATICFPAFAGIPGHLNPLEMQRIVEILGPGSASRLMRSAEPYEAWPGIKLGAEIGLIPGRDIDDLGDKTGSVPFLNPVPRLYMAKGLPFNLELILNFFPSNFINSVATTGAMLKWSFYTEKESWVSGAVYGGITHLDAYGDSYIGNDEEVGVEFSKDYVRLKPYAGAGILLAQANFAPALVLGPNTGASYATIHTFLGFEVEMPVNVTFQLDLMNLSLQGSLLIAKHF